MRRVSVLVLVALVAAIVGIEAPAGARTRLAPSIAPHATTGPASTISGPVTGGKGIFLASSRATNLAAAGYTESEYFASGTARSYSAVGSLGKNGRWRIKPKASATYRTRIVVRTPSDATKFNGTVVVEWLNVSGGIDADPDFVYMGTELLRSGYAWVGVSVQKVGVSGGGAALPIPGAPKGGLRGIDPARYGSLHHPGDAFAYDIFSQIGRAVRNLGKLTLSGSRPLRVLAVGESQSAFALTTYINAFQPAARVYDGFFVHSRGGGALPLAGGNVSTGGIVGAIKIRDDINVPVFLLETETDEAFLRYFDARQPDSKHVRLWDVAGAAHIDKYAIGAIAAVFGCKGDINDSPTHYVVAAGLSRLDQWVRTGTAPASAPRMSVKLVKGSPVVQRDSLGVAIGGVRTAAINVPVAAYSGEAAPGSSVLCLLFGSTHPFDAATLAHLYPTQTDYITAFTQATDADIAAGYVLAADRDAILADAAKVTV